MVADRFKGVGKIGRPTLSSILRVGVISFFDWGFTDAGGFVNVTIPTSGVYGGNQHILKPVSDPNYNDGQVWQSHRGNWVWQSGVNQATQPIDISGVFVGSSFIPRGTGVSIDYNKGRVIFPTSISTTSEVKCEHSYKYVNVIDSRVIPAFKRIQYNSFRVDDSHYNQFASGDWNIDYDNRLQLPAVAVEVVNRREYTPYALGGYQHALTDVVFHVFAEEEQTASTLSDQISYQNEKTIWLIDIRRLGINNAFPINYDGTRINGALSYPGLIKTSGDGGYRWNKCYLDNARVQNGNWIDNSLYHSTVRMRTDVVLTNI